jgi:hypothetical protein
MTSPAKRAWWAANEAAPQSCRWTPELVEARLKEAMRTVGRVVGPVRPKGYGSAMPEYTQPEDKERFQIELSLIREGKVDRLLADANARNRVKIQASVAEINRMEQALWWPSRYLTGTGHFHLETLNHWLACQYSPRQFAPKGKVTLRLPNGVTNKVERQTAEKRLERARYIIATGLIGDGVETGETSFPPFPPISPLTLAPSPEPEPEHPLHWSEIVEAARHPGFSEERSLGWLARREFKGRPHEAAARYAWLSSELARALEPQEESA